MTIFYNSVKTQSDLAKQSQRNMEFCKASHRSLSSKFCHMNVCGFHRQIVFTKGRLANIFKFHAYLSITKVVNDNLKACQIYKPCTKIRVSNYVNKGHN